MEYMSKSSISSSLRDWSDRVSSYKKLQDGRRYKDRRLGDADKIVYGIVSFCDFFI